MSEQSTNHVQATGTPEQAQAPATTAKAKKPAHKATDNDKKAKGLFPTPEEAKAVKADHPAFRLVRVKITRDISLKAGQEFYTQETAHQWGWHNFGRHFGVVCEFAEKPAVKADKESITAALRQLSPEEQAALIAQFVPAPSTVASPHAEPAKGKGRKQPV